ncbi:MAG: glycosyltransferase family 9 protein [bacterium]|nr:glycosyltransferase family 9 protein [bacterium]
MMRPVSILAFRNGSIGNTLAAVPALRAIRAAHPDAQLTVVVDSVGHELLAPCPWINRLIIYEKRGRDHSLARHIRLIRELRALHPTHAVLFKRFFRNGLLAWLSGASTRAGFLTDGKAPFLNRTIPYDESVSVVDLNLRLAALLGASPADRHLELFLTPEDERMADDLRQRRGSAGRYCVAHYGGRTSPPDFFPVERFLSLLRNVAADLDILLIGSGAGERSLAQRFQSLDPRLQDATDLPIRVTAALMRHAEFFIGFDSGPAHLAAAAGARTLIIYRSSENVQRQIRKWLPPSPIAHPLLPPETSDDHSWNKFFDHVRILLEPTGV